MSLLDAFSQNLAAQRRRRKLSQEALAELAGFSVSYVSMLERGLRSPPLGTLEHIAKALRVPPLTLLQAPVPVRPLYGP